jgi:DNA-directed RNA polymerase subunit RPC12/RpoP
MEKQWLCPDCWNKWKAKEEITICCPVCGSKTFYNIGKVKLEL